MPNEDANGSRQYRTIDGRLHLIREIRDEAGKLITTVANPLRVEFKPQDVGQLLTGAFLMAIPTAFTEEVWVLGETLSAGRIWMIAAASIVILGIFTWVLFYGRQIGEFKADFVKRVVVAYGLSLGVALFLLVLIDKGPLDDLALSLRRAVLIAFPAAFAAAAVDYVK